MMKWMQGLWTQGKRFWQEDEGLGTLEIVLIIAVLIVLVLIFKDWIVEFVKGLMDQADDQTSNIFDR